MKSRATASVWIRLLPRKSSCSRLWLTLCLAVLLGGGTVARAQGILTVTPGATAGTLAGTGNVGYSGNNGLAVSAAFASPSAVAYDASGNLYIADRDNNVIREVSTSGTITAVAGTGQQGFGGDGGPATSAWLDTPTGIAVDANGNLYIADSHNERIREVSSGVITTIAGNGTAGFSGDGGPAASAELDNPMAVAVDGSGSLYIADTDNQRIRKVVAGTITTVAGNGQQSFAGDGGIATSASLDSPTGVAVDAAGNLYIADRHNQRIRVVNTAGNISTLAGTGAGGIGGAYSGDGLSATAAVLSKPSGVAVDAQGNVYIADSGNHRLREVGNGAIATLAGAGTQGFGGDGGAATSALLNTPSGAAVDASGNVMIADRLNERIRNVELPALTFAGQAPGSASPPQLVTLANSGSGTLVVQSIAYTSDFQSAAGGTCSAPPISLAAGANCTQAILFFPTSAGTFSGHVIFSGGGVVPQTVLLSGITSGSAPVLNLASSANPSTWGSPVTFTASMASTPVPTGTVTFYDGTTQLAVVAMSSGSASYSSSTLSIGTHSITAKYSGDSNWQPETSSPLSQVVQPATPAITLVSSASPVMLQTPVTLTATVSASTGTPTGSVSFYDGTALLGSASLTSGTATLNTTSLSVGLHSVTAVYSGDSTFASVTSAPLGESVVDFSIALASGSSSVTLPRGKTLNLQFVVTPIDGTTLPAPVALSSSGLPENTLTTFSPSVVAAGSGTTTVTLQITAVQSAAFDRSLEHATPPLLLGILLLPFSRGLRQAGRRLQRVLPLLMLVIAVTGLFAGLTGCGSASGHAQIYTVTVTGTSGTLSHSTSLSVTVK